MYDLPKLKGEQDCDVCGGCLLSCEFDAIDLQLGSVNYYPVVDGKRCIGCKKCETFCTGRKIISKKEVEQYYLCESLDRTTVQESSSGGIFTELSKYVIEKDGIVFGAAFSEGQQEVVHIGCNSMQEIKRCRKSKYVQSNPKGIIKLLKQAVAENRWVLFTGTPCQCAAVHQIYGSYDKMLIVDFFCHGVSNAGVFHEYMAQMGEVSAVDFRATGAEKENYYIRICRENNKDINEVISENIYGKLIISSANLKKTCFACQYAQGNHCSDLTMGDYSFKDENLAEKGYGNHPSILAVNTKRGQGVLSEIKNCLQIEEIKDKNTVAHFHRPHEQMRGSWGYDKEIREHFISDYLKYGFLKAAYRAEYKSDYELCNRIISECVGQRVWIYGAGTRGHLLYRMLKDLSPEVLIAGFIDQNIDINTEIAVKGYKDITGKEAERDVFVIAVYDNKIREQFVRNLAEMDAINVIADEVKPEER